MYVTQLISGNPMSDSKESAFVVSADAESMTRETIMKSGFWFGASKYGKVAVIDTPPLGDSKGTTFFFFPRKITSINPLLKIITFCL